MWPWGHVAVGYLLYSVYCRLRTGRPPGDLPALVAVFGTQVPDLVDKPLAWSLSILPTGRSLGHSFLTAAIVLPIVWVLAARRDARPLGAALAIGYLSHLGADALYPVIERNFANANFLLWPLLPLPTYEVEQSFVAHLARADPSPTFLFELGLVVLASIVWHADGNPGLATVRSWSGRVLEAARA